MSYLRWQKGVRHTGSMPLLWQKDVSADTPYGPDPWHHAITLAKGGICSGCIDLMAKVCTVTPCRMDFSSISTQIF